LKAFSIFNQTIGHYASGPPQAFTLMKHDVS